MLLGGTFQVMNRPVVSLIAVQNHHLRLRILHRKTGKSRESATEAGKRLLKGYPQRNCALCAHILIGQRPARKIAAAFITDCKGPPLAARGRSLAGRVTAKRGRFLGGDDVAMLIHCEESVTTKTAPFRRNPMGAGGPPTFQTEAAGAPQALSGIQ